MTRAAGVPGAEGPGLNARSALLAFCRVVVAEVPPRLVRRVIERLEELEEITALEARDRSRSADTRHELEILVQSYQRAAGALHRAEIERDTRAKR